MVSISLVISSEVGIYILEDASFKSRFNLMISRSAFRTALTLSETVTNATARETPETKKANALVISIKQAQLKVRENDRI